MADLTKLEQTHKILSEYKGSNPFIIKTKNTVFAYRTRPINDFETEYILANHDKEPILLNKIVKIADWFGEKKKDEWGTEFVPQKVKITWFLGETETLYHFYCIYRQSQAQAVEVFANKKAILTDISAEDWHNKIIDFQPYNELSHRVLTPIQEESIKFLTSKKKAILALDMGAGKTMASIVAALVGDYKKILVICPASLKINWQNEISIFEPKENTTIVEGSTWKENKFTIINYDILKNFYTVPTENVKTKELNLNDEGKVVTVEKERKIVSRKKHIVDSAMENSQLFQSKFDLIIIDEAHKLSNNSSGIFRIVSDLVKRSNPNGIFELSGTPITNKPINLYNLLKIINAPVSRDWKYYVERYCDGKTFFNKKERAAYTKIFFGMKHKKSWNELSHSEQVEYYDFLDKKCKKIWVTNGASHLDELQEVIKPYYLRRTKEELNNMVKKTIKYLSYPLTNNERKEYDNLWNEYAINQAKSIEDLEKLKKLTEGSILRQWIADKMTSRTIELVKKMVQNGHKVVVFCCFDKELYSIYEAFKDIAVYHNGKLSMANKEKSVVEFQNNPNVKVFVGNIISSGVGITLTASDVCIFNNFDYVPGNNAQAMDRIHRLNQTKDVTVYFQTFENTFYTKMLELVNGKQEIINNIIITENEK